MKNTIPILCMYARSGNPIFIATDKTTDAMAAVRTERAVAFFQNKATKNITKIPGVKRPVNSCMYWNILSKLPRRGFATNAAITTESSAEDLPIFNNVDCDGF